MKLAFRIIASQIVITVITVVFSLILIPELIFSNFRGSIQAQTTNYTLQIMSNISSKLSENRRIANVLAADEGLKEQILAYYDNPKESELAGIRLYLSGFFLRDSLPSYKLLGVYISMDDGGEFTSVGFSEDVKQYLKETIIPELKETKSGTMMIDPFQFSSNSSTIWANNFEQVYGYAVRFKAGNKVGTLTMLSPFDDVVYLLSGVKDSCRDYQLLNTENTVLYSSQKESLILAEQILDTITYGETFQSGYTSDRKSLSVVTFTQDNAKWKLICRLTKGEIIAQNRKIFHFSVMMMIVFEILANIVTAVAAERVLRPLNEVSAKMSKVADGNTHVHIAYQANDEVGDVVNAFNLMTRKLSDYIRQLIEKEKLEQKLRYSILISRVDPHFIYNTMNTITYLAEQNRCKDVVVVNNAMIGIMRDRLRIELTDVFDTVSQEVEVLQQYFTIQQYRFEKVFKYEIEVPVELKELYIAKSILQPIAENALLHGILMNRDEDGELIGGLIRICFSQKDAEHLLITVADNGIGMDAETIQKVMQKETGKEPHIRGKHIGVRNVRNRIDLLYQGEASFEIESGEEQGTIVKMVLPIRKRPVDLNELE
ncbi:MAG: histidine kinase [Lachnospiraceae bacterium]|nr:histidine kinase [Lachnospiraceae bacterium]